MQWDVKLRDCGYKVRSSYLEISFRTGQLRTIQRSSSWIECYIKVEIGNMLLKSLNNKFLISFQQICLFVLETITSKGWLWQVISVLQPDLVGNVKHYPEQSVVEWVKRDRWSQIWALTYFKYTWIEKKKEWFWGNCWIQNLAFFPSLDFSTESWIHFIRCSVVQLFNNANMPYAQDCVRRFIAWTALSRLAVLAGLYG